MRSSRELLPLALTREEWEKIGQAMGWLSKPENQNEFELHVWRKPEGYFTISYLNGRGICYDIVIDGALECLRQELEGET